MIRRALVPVAFSAALVVSAASAPGSAQMQRSVLESLNMWSPPRWNATKTLGLYEVHSETVSNYATNLGGTADDPVNVAYFKYNEPAGSIVYFDPSFATAVPPPVGGTDACHHAHLEWAVYRAGIRYVNVGFANLPFPYMALKSSTGELGRRMINGTQVRDLVAGAECVISPAPDTIYPDIAGPFLWGPYNQAAAFGREGNIDFSLALVAVQATTHGWYGCGVFQCYPPVNMYAYRFQ